MGRFNFFMKSRWPGEKVAQSQAYEMLIKPAISHKTSVVVQVLLLRPIVSRTKFVSLIVVTAITAQ